MQFKCQKQLYFKLISLVNKVNDVAPERVTNENANTDIRKQIILHKKELHRKGKKSRTVRITPILIYPTDSEISQY